MTGYDGSRASGYPPDLMPFRRYAGAPRRLRPLARMWPLRARRLALRLSGESRSGAVMRSGGDATRTDQSYPAGAVHDGQQRRRARPNQAWLDQPTVHQIPALARGRASEASSPFLHLHFGSITITSTDGAGNGSTEPRRSDQPRLNKAKNQAALFYGSVEPFQNRRTISDLRRDCTPFLNRLVVLTNSQSVIQLTQTLGCCL
jgi:hypothetical protein